MKLMACCLSKTSSHFSTVPSKSRSNLCQQKVLSVRQNSKGSYPLQLGLSWGHSCSLGLTHQHHPTHKWPKSSQKVNRKVSTEAKHNMTEATHRKRSASSRRRQSLPAVIPLSERAFSAVLPASGTGEQVLKELGGPATWLRRAVVSMAGAAVFYNINMLITIVAAFYWAWSPMFSAAKRNAILRLKYKFAGVWRAKIVEARLMKVSGQNTMLHVLIGDDSGTLVEMDVPAPSSPVAFTGDSVEMLVLSDRRNFSRFRVLREVYLPEQPTWIAEQLFLERSVFEQLSKEMALLLLTAKQDEEEDDDWEGRCVLAADGLAHDVEQYSSYSSSSNPQRRLAASTLDTWHSADFDSCCGCGSDMADEFSVSCMACEGQEVEYFHDHCASRE